jgi:hypothetical protein
MRRQKHCYRLQSTLQPGPLADSCSWFPERALLDREKPGYCHQMAITGVPGTAEIVMHAATIHDEMVSLSLRHLQPVPLCDTGSPAFRDFRWAMRKISRQLGHVDPWTHSEVVNHYKGALRRKYQHAMDKLASNPLTDIDSHTKMFVKCEKWFVDGFVSKPPRGIQARTPEYNLELATFLKPIESRLYCLRNRRSGTWLPKTRVIAKGLNQRDRAILAMRKLRGFTSPVMVPLDASKFDAHVDEPMLREEHKVYLRVHRNARRLAQLLGRQLNNRGRTSHGVKYKCRARRMSGDLNTAMGNCLHMVGMLVGLVRNLGIKHWDMMCDGDDAFLIIEEVELSRVMIAIPPYFLSLGQEIKVEQPVRNLSDLVFCQCKVVDTISGPTFTRDYRKVLSTCFVSHKHYSDSRGCWRVMRAIADCEAALGAGLPVLQAYFQAWRRKLSGVRPARLDVRESVLRRAIIEYGPVRLDNIAPKVVTLEARASFESAFGLAVEEQQSMERFLEWYVESYPLVNTFDPGTVSEPDLLTMETPSDTMG